MGPSHTTMVEDVTRAQRGDREAFGRLVARFQDMAVGYALAWVKDPSTAEDIAQDAFIDAYRSLGQLRDPQAFAGWFRRVVRKHCDRRTRRRAIEVEAEPSAEEPDERLFERTWLSDAIASLPEHERIVVALHYLGDEPQKEVADFLELPLSTVKKRLHSARARLRKRRTKMQNLRPSTATRFSDRIQLFLAVRSSDRDAASAILDRAPELLDAEEQWTTAEALSGGFPLAHRLTPLVLAAGRGDQAMVRMLLSRGAEVDRTCGCDNGETALWTASRCGHQAVVETLLTAGANPDVKNQAGYTPAEVAQLRATERVSIVDDRIETGIKAIDLLVPLQPHMLVRVHGAAETGMMVLLAELTSRFGDAVWCSWEAHPWHQGELAAYAAEAGIRPELDGDWRGRPLFLFAREGYEAEMEARLPRLREASIAFVVDPWVETTRGAIETPELAAPFDALIVTDPALAKQNIYPAIDRRRSASRAPISARHGAVMEAVRGSDDPQVLGAMGQWFGVYQHQTGRPGETSTLEETLAGFEALIRSR